MLGLPAFNSTMLALLSPGKKTKGDVGYVAFGNWRNHRRRSS